MDRLDGENQGSSSGEVGAAVSSLVCPVCSAASFREAESLAFHFMNEHGLTRQRAFAEAGVGEESEPPAATAPVARASGYRRSQNTDALASEARKAQSHAALLDQVALALLALGLIGALLVVVVDEGFIGLAIWSAVGSVATWAVLRAIAIHLRLVAAIGLTMRESAEST